jgi:hypothetical protein
MANRARFRRASLIAFSAPLTDLSTSLAASRAACAAFVALLLGTWRTRVLSSAFGGGLAVGGSACFVFQHVCLASVVVVHLKKCLLRPCILAHWDWFALIPIKHGAGRNTTFYALPGT